METATQSPTRQDHPSKVNAKTRQSLVREATVRPTNHTEDVTEHSGLECNEGAPDIQ